MNYIYIPVHTDSCVSVDCPPHTVCRVFPQTGEPYCDPSCDIDNGGCEYDEICQLLATPCAAPPPPRPCPHVIVCVAPTRPTQEVTDTPTQEVTPPTQEVITPTQEVITPTQEVTATAKPGTNYSGDEFFSLISLCTLL